MDLEPCKIKCGRMAKLAHAPHLKCVGRNTLSVQIRLRPPYYNKRKEVLKDLMLLIEYWRKLKYPKLPDKYNHYLISSEGKLKNIKTNYILKPNILKSGYYSIRISLGNRNQKIHIILHKAVAYTFIPNNEGLTEVNHIDGNKLNNSVSNLEWCTSHQNQQHKYDTGLFDKSKISAMNNHNAKLSWDDVKYIRENYIKGSKEYGCRALSQKFNVSYPTISAILNNKTWIDC